MKKTLTFLGIIWLAAFAVQADMVDLIIEVDDPNVIFESVEYYEIVLGKTIELELYDVADKRLTEVYEKYPEESRFLFFEEIVARETGNEERAERVRISIVENQDLSLGREEYYILRSKAYTASTQGQEARAVLLEGEASHPGSSIIQHLLGRNCMDLGMDLETEISYYDRAIELDPDFFLAFFDRGGAYSAMGDLSKSNADYLSCIDAGYNPGESYNCLAMNYNAAGETDKAIEANLLSIKHDETNISSYTNLCNIYRSIQEFDKGIEIALRGLEHDPDNYYALLNLGLCYSSLQNFDRGIETFTRFIELYPRDAYGWYFRGQCYKALGDEEKATADMGEAERIQQG